MSLRTLSLIRVVPLCAATLLLAACGEDTGPLQTNDSAFAWHGVVPAGTTLHVRELQGSIDVVPSTSDTLRVTARTEWRRGDPAADLTFSASQDSAGVLVCAIWGEGQCNKESSNATVRFGRRFGGHSTDAKVFFRVELPTGVLLDLVNINGDISAVASAPVRARTMNGSVRIVTAVGPVRAETMNGSVDVRMSSITGTDSVIAKTLNGDAFVYIPDGIDATLDMAVTNGSLSTEFPVGANGAVDQKHLRATLGMGTHPILIKSLNGEVALRRLDAEGKSARP